jgi:hypothetical protein
MDNLPTSCAEDSLRKALERFCGDFRVDPARIATLDSGGQLLGPFFSRSIETWAAQLVADEDRPIERRHFVAARSLDFGACQAILDLRGLANKWHRPPIYVALCPYPRLNDACNTLLTLANQYLDWRFSPTEALEAHIRYCIDALGLAESSKTEVVEPDKVYRPSYGAAFELIIEDTDHDLAAYFNLSEASIWKPIGVSLGDAGSVQLAFVDGEVWTELPYSQSPIHSGLCAFCRPGVTNEHRAIRDLETWLKEYRQLRQPA